MAAALQLVGERWSLLVIRELFFGNRRFDQIARNTGAPRDILSARLKSLERAGIIARSQYTDKPPRYEYDLTEAGLDLQDVMRSLLSWGNKWAVERPPIQLRHRHHLLDSVLVCRTCGDQVKREDLVAEVLAPGWNSQGPVETPRRPPGK